MKYKILIYIFNPVHRITKKQRVIVNLHWTSQNQSSSKGTANLQTILERQEGR